MQAWSEWDIPSIQAQLRYWLAHPPVHLLVAAYLDYKPTGQGSTRSSAANDASVQALMAMAPAMPDHLKTRIPRHV